MSGPDISYVLHHVGVLQVCPERCEGHTPYAMCHVIFVPALLVKMSIYILEGIRTLEGAILEDKFNKKVPSMNAMKQLIKEASSEQKCFAIENALELRAKRNYYITA